MPLCLYASGRCSQCGEPLEISERRECTAPQPAPPSSAQPLVCDYFLGGTGETVLLTGCPTCGGRGEFQASVGDCELHGRCLTFVGGDLADSTIRRCQSCADDTRRR